MFCSNSKNFDTLCWILNLFHPLHIRPLVLIPHLPTHINENNLQNRGRIRSRSFFRHPGDNKALRIILKQSLAMYGPTSVATLHRAWDRPTDAADAVLWTRILMPCLEEVGGNMESSFATVVPISKRESRRRRRRSADPSSRRVRSTSEGTRRSARPHHVSRQSSTESSVTSLDVRCACQYFQGDLLLPERKYPVRGQSANHVVADKRYDSQQTTTWW